MNVAITGGTGFVGSHTVAELIRQGHEVKLLVRSADRVRPALEPLGVGEVETIVGDVTDEASVSDLLTGCDAVIHSASVYSLDPSAARAINETNVKGTDLVLGKANELGLDPIVYVSSFVSFLGATDSALTTDSVPTRPKGVYSASKADAERVARRYQESGAPVVIVYPGSIWGPNDPHFGDSCIFAKGILSNYLMMMPSGGLPISDVREVASLHAAVLERDRGPRRYFAPVHNTPVKELYKMLSNVTGRSLPVVTFPRGMVLPPLVALAAAERILKVRTPWSYEGAAILASDTRVDDSLTRSELGIESRPLEETVADTVTWMAEVGFLSKRLAGKAV